MASRTRTGILLAMLVATAAAAAPLTGQEDARLEAMASWVAMDAATGYETRVTPGMAEAMDGWSSDRWGNLVATVGSGSPRRIVACALDRPSYAASQITADGYLRVHRIGRGSNHPLWDQAFEAQPVRVLTRTGPVAGVVARSNGHFAAQHRHETAVVGADDLWVDVGAESAAEVAALGIELLDPIARHLPPWPLAGGVAGPDAGRRTGCAAVATLAAAARDGRAPSGETHFVMSAQEVLGWIGLSSYVARGGSFDQVAVLAPGEAEGRISLRAADSFGRFGAVLESAGVGEVTWIVPAATSPGSHMEQVRLEDATTLLAAAAAASGVRVDPEADWVAAPPRPPCAHATPTPPSTARRNSCAAWSTSTGCPTTSGRCGGWCSSPSRSGPATGPWWTTWATSWWRPARSATPPSSWPTWTRSATRSGPSPPTGWSP